MNNYPHIEEMEALEKEVFESVVCAVCGQPKKMRHYFCMPCWDLLPWYIRRAFNVSAYPAAVEFLEKIKDAAHVC